MFGKLNWCCKIEIQIIKRDIVKYQEGMPALYVKYSLDCIGIAAQLRRAQVL